MDKTKYYVVKKKALPEVLLKVVEVKRLLEANDNMSVQEATEQVGLSRSSFYKYKDDIFPFHSHEKGQTITLMVQAEDRPGVLADVLQTIARYGANILTIALINLFSKLIFKWSFFISIDLDNVSSKSFLYQ